MKQTAKTLILIFTLLFNSNLRAQTKENEVLSSFQEGTTRGLEQKELKTDKLAANVFIDERDGKQYEYVKIGNQTWMAENMAYLPKVCPPTEDCGYWVYGFYRDNVGMAKANNNYKTFGVLYNYEAASKACPPGWHLPTDEEWKILEFAHGMKKKDLDKSGERGNIGIYLRSKRLWEFNYNQANKMGLKALPAGFLVYTSNDFIDLGRATTFWAGENSEGQLWCRCIKYNTKKIERNYPPRPNGLSVRCIKD